MPIFYPPNVYFAKSMITELEAQHIALDKIYWTQL